MTNLFLVLWWIDHHHEESWWEHLIEMVDLTDTQEEFLEGLPRSAAAIMNDLAKSSGPMLALLNQDYRRSLLADEPAAQRKQISLEASLARERKRIVEEFLMRGDISTRRRADELWNRKK